MTNKALVQSLYPKAYSCKVWGQFWYVFHIKKGPGQARQIASGKTVKEAWANAGAKLKAKCPVKPKKAAKKVTSIAQAKRIMSNAELNSGWKTTVIDHGKADSMAGWPAYSHDELPSF